MEGLVRARTLRGFEDCVRARGGDPNQIFATTGLSSSQIADEEGWLPFESVLLAYEAASRHLQDPGFGMHLVSYRDLSFMGPIFLTARYADDLRQAIIDVARYLMVQNTGWRLSLKTEPTQGILTPLLPPRLRLIANQWIEESLATTISFCSEFVRRSFRPTRVHMRHQAISPLRDYEALFGCEVLFDQPADAVYIDAEDLACPNPNRDESTHEFMVRYLTQHLPRTSGQDIDATIRLLLDELIPLGQARIEVVAQQLFLHPRTLQRRLEAMGMTFAQMLDEERRRLAERLLRQGNLPIVNIAFYLGYSNQSAFNHAFKRWHGVAPTRWLLDCPVVN